MGSIRTSLSASPAPEPMMAPIFFDIAPLLPHLESASPVLTSNRRLARHIIKSWGQHCLAQGLKAWPRPPVQALEDWLNSEREIRNSNSAVCIVDQTAENWLWRQAIARDQHLDPQADIPSLALRARQALQLLLRYNIPRRELANAHHKPSQSLLGWINDFQNELDRLGLITPEQGHRDLLTRLLELRDNAQTPYSTVCLVGFMALPPLHQQIIEAAARKIIRFETNAPSAPLHVTKANNEFDEIRAAANWSKIQLIKNPNARIGIVIDQLTSRRVQVVRIFDEVFRPNANLPNNPRQTPEYNLSAGTPLANTPLIASALELLRVEQSALRWQDYCQILHNPFWGHNNQEETPEQSDIDVDSRVRCELKLRDNDQLRYRPAEFRAALAGAETAAGASNTPLTNQWQALADQQRHESSSTRFSLWSKRFEQRLEILGWPGPRPLDSVEYQQHQHWQQLLADFSALDVLDTEVNSTQAHQQLTDLAHNSVFQAQVPDSPIQILGVLEAAALQFDHLWLCGVDNNQWPPVVALHPLLPPELQRRYRMPRSEPEAEFQLAVAQLQGFRQQAGTFICSYSTGDTDTPRQASRLLNDYTIREQPDSDQHHPLLDKFTVLDLESLSDEQAPAAPSSNDHQRGGIAVLRDQATCPFNAFAIWRLGAQTLNEPAPGLAPRVRGNILHRCLELLWQQLGDQNQLNKITDTALDLMIHASVENTLREIQQQAAELQTPRYRELENARLIGLLKNWLKYEKTRGAFTVIARELPLSVELKGLRLRLKLDRLDRLEDQRLILIDYKSGGISINGWLRERLGEPQLPLYATALGDTSLLNTPVKSPIPGTTSEILSGSVAGLCLARIAAAGIGCKGLSDTPESIPGLEPLSKYELDDWPKTLSQWRQQLEGLAEEFMQGRAGVEIYDINAERFQAWLRPLNRLPELLDTAAEATA